MDLKYRDSAVLIEGLELPQPYKISLSKRGKTVYNHRYLEDARELQVQCSNCKKWHSVYKYEINQWIDINKNYKVCNLGKATQYFDSYCNNCYSSKINKNEVIRNNIEMKEVPVPAGGINADRIQRTVFLSKENDLYLQLFSIEHKGKKNAILNEIIDEFRKEHSINVFR